jgi:hypothetical protein
MNQNKRGTGARRAWAKKAHLSIRFPLLLALAAVLSPFCSSALADQFHNVNTLIGDRASGMGGAYTAISDDATGLYYNPAGIVYASGRDLTVSANVYFHTVKSYKGALSRFDWNRVSSALLPNYFGAVQPLGPVKIGFSYAVPDSSQEDQDQTFNDVSQLTKQYTINFHAKDTTYNFGPTIAAPITDSLSVGMTLYYYLRQFSYIQKEVNIYNTPSPTYGWTNRIFDLMEKGLRPVIGVMWLPMEKFSLGFSLSKVYLLDSIATQQDTCSDTNIDGVGCDTPFTMVDTTIKDKRKFPTHAAAGAAYYLSPDLLVSGDLNYYTKVVDQVGGNQPSLANLALGAEYSLTHIWTVRGGVFTDLANTPDVVATGTQQLEHVDLYGASMSVRHSKSKTTSVTLGGSYADGTGKAQIRGGSNDIQTVKLTEWTVFLSSSYSY